MVIYETYYAAKKARATYPDYSTADRIVKVGGGYTIMDVQTYNIWKKQK